jgi:transposase-like protein
MEGLEGGKKRLSGRHKRKAKGFRKEIIRRESSYEMLKAYWRKLRTTNPIERQFVEVRRRTRPMRCFQNRGSVERIIFAIFNRQNRIWGN